MSDSTEALTPIPPGQVPGTVVARDVECVGCGYNLRTQPVAGRCPECAQDVESSLLVLPQAELTASAITLAAWALLIQLVLNCGRLDIVGSIILLVAAYQLHYRCDLRHMKQLGARVRWFWITMLLSTAGGLFAALLGMGMLAVTFLGGARITTTGSATSVTAYTSGATSTSDVSHSALGVKLRLATDAQGRTTVTTFDARDKVLSTAVLQTGKPTVVLDADQSAVTVTRNADGSVQVTPASGDPFTVDPGSAQLGPAGGGPPAATPGTAPAPPGSLAAPGSPAPPGGPAAPAPPGPVNLRTFGMSRGIGLVFVTGLFGLVGTAAAVLYLLVCHGLAIRAGEAGLARDFRKILWLLAVGLGGGMLLGGGLPLIWLGTAGGWRAIMPFIALGLVAGIAWIIGAIWQIKASFRLGKALRAAPRDWSEITTAPQPETPFG